MKLSTRYAAQSVKITDCFRVAATGFSRDQDGCAKGSDSAKPFTNTGYSYAAPE
jgi:hypothetical protein